MSYLIYNGKRVQYQGKYTTNTGAPAILETIYLGTDPSGYILKSIDSGVSFSINQNLDLGVPISSAKNTSLIWFASNTGYAIKLLGESATSYPISVDPLTAIYSNADYAVDAIVGGFYGEVWYTNDDGDTWGDLGTGSPWFNDRVNGFSYNGDLSNLLIYASSGIYYSDGLDSSGLIQSGNFTAVCEIGDGSVYAGTNNGHVWKSTDSGANWTDLGEKSGDGYSISFIIKTNNNRFILGRNSGYGMFYTDDDFANMQQVGISAGHLSGVWLGGDVVLAGTNNGKVIKSVNNGTSWTEIAGNPQQGQSKIYALIKV
jgi:hypothetical protein